MIFIKEKVRDLVSLIFLKTHWKVMNNQVLFFFKDLNNLNSIVIIMK